MILYRGHDLCEVPLIAKHIDVRKLCGIGSPTQHIIQRRYICVDFKLIRIWLCSCHKVINIFATCCARNSILRSSNIIPSPLYCKLIDVRFLSWVRHPRIIYAGGIYPIRNIPICQITLCICYYIINIFYLYSTVYTILRPANTIPMVLCSKMINHWWF